MTHWLQWQAEYVMEFLGARQSTVFCTFGLVERKVVCLGQLGTVEDHSLGAKDAKPQGACGP